MRLRSILGSPTMGDRCKVLRPATQIRRLGCCCLDQLRLPHAAFHTAHALVHSCKQLTHSQARLGPPRQAHAGAMPHQTRLTYTPCISAGEGCPDVRATDHRRSPKHRHPA